MSYGDWKEALFRYPALSPGEEATETFSSGGEEEELSSGEEKIKELSSAGREILCSGTESSGREKSSEERPDDAWHPAKSRAREKRRAYTVFFMLKAPFLRAKASARILMLLARSTDWLL